MTDPAPLSISFPAIRSKKVTGAFDGGAITSDAGVLLLAQAERRMGIVDRLAVLIPDDRNPARVVHGLADILRARVLAIAALHFFEPHDRLLRAPSRQRTHTNHVRK